MPLIIFGVVNMEQIVSQAEEQRAPFIAMRDYVYDRLLSEEERDHLRTMAAQLSPGPKLIN